MLKLKERGQQEEDVLKYKPYLVFWLQRYSLFLSIILQKSHALFNTGCIYLTTLIQLRSVLLKSTYGAFVCIAELSQSMWTGFFSDETELNWKCTPMGAQSVWPDWSKSKANAPNPSGTAHKQVCSTDLLIPYHFTCTVPFYLLT